MPKDVKQTIIDVLLAFSIVMFTAMFAMVADTWKSQKNLEALYRNHLYDSKLVVDYAIRRFEQDSISIIKLQSDNSKIKCVLRKIDPQAFMEEFYDKDSFYLFEKSQAIIQKKNYKPLNI